MSGTRLYSSCVCQHTILEMLDVCVLVAIQATCVDGLAHSGRDGRLCVTMSHDPTNTASDIRHPQRLVEIAPCELKVNVGYY